MFHPTRKWRFDFAFTNHKLAIEIQGYGKGHADYMSMANDYTKHNEAVRLGWSILYFMGHDIKDEAINKTIEYVLNILNHTPTTPRETAADLFRKLHAKHTGDKT